MQKTRYIGLFLALSVLAATITCTAYGQGVRLDPTWWFGGAAGANFNFYSGTVANLNLSLQGRGPFTKGSGTGIFLSPVLEYRPDPVWGGMLFLGFDGRGGSFDDVAGAKVSTSVNYLSLEPSLRVSPFESGLYLFAGPRLGFNVAKSFSYEQGGVKTDGDWSDTRGTAIGGQVGAGYDIRISSPESEWQTDLSPFAAVHFGQGPRSTESWTLTTVRVGLAVKFGSTKEVLRKTLGEATFTVRAPKVIPKTRIMKETFPLRNYVFFDEGSGMVPARYATLTKDHASQFQENQLLEPQPDELTGRSRRQMKVYDNILNVIGDRMRRYPDATVTLTGASLQGPEDGEKMASAIRGYLSEVFAVAPERIKIRGESKPSIPSMAPGATRELDLVRPEDRRVDIASPNVELLDPVQIVSFQEEPLDCDVLFNAPNAGELFASWSVDLKDENGAEEHYGPFTSDEERVSGKTILGARMNGRYTATLEGRMKDGAVIRKETSFQLVRSERPEEVPGYRFSVLFEFDQSKTIATYERFLTQTVAPLISDGSSVIIHGHTDIIGEESHNLKLSQDRAHEAMKVLETALARAGRKGVKFDTYGFGEDVRRAPFDNDLPEERFYNRTVIIDIVPEQ